MTFNDNARLDPSKVKRRRRTATGIGVGGGLGAIALVVISQLVGIDLTGLAPLLGGGSGTSQQDPGTSPEECRTGSDANANVECLVVGAATSLDDYWAGAAATVGADNYTTPGVYTFDGSTDTGCGAATAAVGPFYCPPDTSIYLDTAFYDDLRSKYGSSGGPLAELYVVAHEWGHHIQSLTGVLERSQDGDTGPTSNGVRVELQADCYAGAWASAAAGTKDVNGNPLLEQITDAQLTDALSAAAAVGDDRIQGTTANSESWTHGSSEKRQKWFTAGYNGGPTACDTFAPATP
ncbi:MAG: neutral zinc metallopeptidase [Naasia sp.]|jgi:predicted metalloprotease|uniref:KPN_02809 family neutral zinc metallopeptidase n=1 Tax=Naasia sp. TaxID=2546198 RepID=UPI002601985D|nr:neutral zinc metallopeptidase [Naasia sp.]MCU1571222.1 neutral zinc metallopeptidase [Naasia sp.]